jgi:hypothetical protein
VTCIVRDRGEVVFSSTTGERLNGGWFSRGAVGVSLAHAADGKPVPLDVEVRVERAVEALASHPARLRVVAAGDWIHYSWLEAAVRRVLVVLGMVVALTLLFVVWRIMAKRARRLAEALEADVFS